MKQIPIDDFELLEFVKTHTNREAASRFGVSAVTISRRLKRLNATKRGFGPGKVKPGVAKEIRRLYNKDLYTQNDLATMFGISRKSVNMIVNFKSHVDVDMGTKGTADVSLIFKVEACLSKTKTEPHSNCKDQIH
jgi:DNA-binding transcriptional regulator LsrR (DeoR family)